MWPKWGKISGSDSSGAVVVGSSTPTAHSFKGIHSLLRDEDDTGDAGDVHRRKSSVFHRVRMATAALRTWRSLPALAFSVSENKRIVVYYTSLHVVRRTFEDCRAVRSILRGFRVSIDERDLTMDSAFLNELKVLLGCQQLSLPRVFIGGRYIGGADEIRQLNESGELKRYIEGAPPAAASACEACDGVRFLLCSVCNGSRKFYSEKGGFRSCGSCNEYGLVRCPDCYTSIV